MASNSKKRRRVLGASCILAALIIASSSFAWFTSSDEVTNRLSASADYGVAITESFTPPEEWVPGQSVNKDTYAVNTGTVDALVMQSVSGKMSINYETTTKTDPANEADAVNKSKYVTLETKYSEAVQPDGSVLITSDEVTALQAGSTVAYAPLQVAKDVTVEYDNSNPKRAKSVKYETYTGTADPSKCIYPVGESAYNGTAHTDTAPVYYQNIIGAIVTAVDGTYTTKDGNNSLSLVAGDPDNSDKIGVSFDGATFQPNTTGLYIFRRAIDKNDSTTADTTQDYEYVGYYYIQNGTTHNNGEGTYYKVDNEALTAAMRSGAFSSYMNDEGLLLTYKINENSTTAATPGNDATSGAAATNLVESSTASQALNTAVSSSNYFLDDYLTYTYIDDNDAEAASASDAKTGYAKVTTDLEAATTAYKYESSAWSADGTKNGAIYVVEADKVVTPKLTWQDQDKGNDTAKNLGYLIATYDNGTTVADYESDYTTTLVTNGDTLVAADTTAAEAAIGETWTATPTTDAQKIANQKIIVAAREKKYDDAERAYVAAKEAYEAANAAGLLGTADMNTLKTAMTDALTKMNANKAAWAKSQGILDTMEKATQDDTIVNIKLTENAIAKAATEAEKWQMITVPMTTAYNGTAQNQVAGNTDDYRFADDTAYFYYTSVLESGQTSAQLIDSVELDKSVTQYAFKDIDFDLNIGLNSIQHLVAENGDEVLPTVDTKAALQAGATVFNELKINNSTTPLYPKATYDATNVTEINYIDWSTTTTHS